MAAPSRTMQRVFVAMVVVVSLMVQVQRSAGFSAEYGCGTGHEHVQTGPVVEVPQQYHTSEHVPEHIRRRLVDQEYQLNRDGSFLPISVAAESKLTGPIRIAFLWDVVEGGDYTGSRSGTQARQCSAVGKNLTLPTTTTTNTTSKQRR